MQGRFLSLQMSEQMQPLMLKLDTKALHYAKKRYVFQLTDQSHILETLNVPMCADCKTDKSIPPKKSLMPFFLVISGVICQVPCFMCHVSCVKCHVTGDRCI